MLELEARKRPSQTKRVGVIARYLLPTFGNLSLLLILYLLVISSSRFLRDSDTGWHIRTGQLILQEGTVPRRDPFSHSLEGREWFAWEWLTDLAMAGLYRWRGLAGIVAGAFLILLVSYAALFKMMIWRGADPMIAGSVTVFGAIASIVHWLARPHLVSIALMIVWYAMVESYRRSRTRWIWGGPLLIACWANLHGAFVITFVVLIIYALGEWLEFIFDHRWDHRWWDKEIKRVLVTYLCVAVISALASLATPYGFNLYRHLWGYLTDAKLLASISEFQSPDFHSVDGKLIEILLLLSVTAVVIAIRHRRFVEVGLVFLWGHLTLQSERHITLCVVMLAPIIAEQLTKLFSEISSKIAQGGDGGSKVFRAIREWCRGMTAINFELSGSVIYVGIAGFVIAAAIWPWGDKILSPQFNPKYHPIEAADFILQSPPSGPMYANDQFGGYLIYRLYPKVKVFVDGRSDFYRQGSVLNDADALLAVRPEWQNVLDKYRIEWMVLKRNEPLALIAQMSGQWTSIHEDKTAQILTRKNSPATQAVTGKARSEP